MREGLILSMATNFGRPAGYSPTSASERSAVSVVAHFLNPDFCKSHFAIDDKVPNTDGFITVTGNDQVPIGRLDVQIKKISAKGKPAYQCKKQFLGFCTQSQLPVLLIGVDTETQKVYWKHFSHEFLADLSARLKGESIKIYFDEADQICKGTSDYVERWKEILATQRKLFTNAVYYAERIIELEKQAQTFSEYGQNSLGKSSEDFRDIHRFLDFYNRLMDTDFNIIKRVMYDNAWKLGFAYANNRENYIEYSLYPIGWEQNDVQIKALPNRDEIWDQFSWISMDHESHIKDPSAFSYRIIQRDIRDLFKHKAILFFTEELAAEYVFDFIDVYYRDLGCREGLQECSVSDILNKIQAFRQKRNIDSMFSEEYLIESLLFLSSLKKANITRPLAKHKSVYMMNAEEWKRYDATRLLALLNDYYHLFPKLYIQFVRSYFPGLVDALGYFSDFDKQLILIKSHPSVEERFIVIVLNLRRIDGALGDHTPMFINRDLDDSLLQGISRWDYINVQPVLNETRYRVVEGIEGGLGFLFKHFTLFNGIYNTAEKKLAEYFKKRTGKALGTI